MAKNKFPGVLKKYKVYSGSLLIVRILLRSKDTKLGPNNIRSGFRKYGIVPLDRRLVLGRLPPSFETDGKEPEDRGEESGFIPTAEKKIQR